MEGRAGAGCELNSLSDRLTHKKKYTDNPRSGRKHIAQGKSAQPWASIALEIAARAAGDRDRQNRDEHTAISNSSAARYAGSDHNPPDSIATIETEGLLGNKYIAVSFGSAEAEQVRNGESIESRPAVDYGDVAKKASDMLDSAKQAVDSSKVAIGNINEATDDMKSITEKMNSGQGTMGALLNDRSLYQGLNSTVAQAQAGATSFQENMEALKHNFFLRGFFKKRGYFDSSELTAHAIAKLPARAPIKKFTFDGAQLFDRPDAAKLGKEKSLNQVGTFLEGNPFSLAVISANTGPQGKKEDNLKLSQARAMIVRQYLAQKFKLDDARIKTMGIGESQPTSGSSGT